MRISKEFEQKIRDFEVGRHIGPPAQQTIEMLALGITQMVAAGVRAGLPEEFLSIGVCLPVKIAFFLGEEVAEDRMEGDHNERSKVYCTV